MIKVSENAYFKQKCHSQRRKGDLLLNKFREKTTLSRTVGILKGSMDPTSATLKFQFTHMTNPTSY